MYIKKLNKVANKWRQENGYAERGGVIITDGVSVVFSWCAELCNPENWEPGCIAIDEAGNRWLSAGGNKQDGAEKWIPITDNMFGVNYEEIKQ